MLTLRRAVGETANDEKQMSMVPQTAENRGGIENSGTDRWLRREAIQIVAQLPDDESQALMVLEYARQLVVGFLAEHQPQAGRREDTSDLRIRELRVAG
jgi:hypothetical protein